ncbi:ATP/GTP-binding protein [Streptomyces sp. NBC_01450]|uniref:ATP/GTP-binding protein n=1 Tax=Streptomyces sp. NBC_01450 TaxID=2903871 RepID=UPI002E35E261|nr:ATP/GTP-binding protein [Streptomyces sp. NBC_01450]
MDGDGTQDARGGHTGAVPGPAVPPPPGKAPAPAPPGVPPMPRGTPPRPAGLPSVPEQSPAPRPTVADWLNKPRPAAGPGIWRYGYRVRRPSKGRERLSPVTVVGLAVPLVVALVVWSLWRHGSVPYMWVVLKLFTPDDWWWSGTTSPKEWQGAEAIEVYNGVFFGVLVYAMGRLGSWPEVVRHYVTGRPQPLRAALAALGALIALTFVFPNAFPGVGWDALPVVAPLFSLVALVFGGYDLFQSQLITDGLYTLITLLVLWPFARIGAWRGYVREWLAARAARNAAQEDGTAKFAPDLPAAQWPELRDAGQHEAAELLTAEVLGGRMNDVDCARVRRAWTTAKWDATRLTAFVDTVLRRGGAAWTHPSGARDLPARTAAHDVLVGQVRIGRWTTGDRTPEAYDGGGAALDPEALGTSLLAVGPSGSGKTRHLVGPVVESLALQALTGRCAVVAVAAAGTPLGPDSAFDVVVKIGDPASVHDLDLYADSEDPDEAASFLAEGLAGDLDTVAGQRATTALAQLLGPYRAVHGTFPPMAALRELLEGVPAALTALHEALSEPRHAGMRRELEARMRQVGSPADAGPALADRLALLDRPAFADFFGAGGTTRAFSLRAVAHHPLRVRIDLPEHGHEEAARLLARLVLAQFTAVVRGGERPHFACLVLDDATGTLTTDSVRRIQRLRSQNAGVVLALRTIGDIPEALHGPLYGAVGCRMAFSGVTTWDGSRFAHAWGTEWVETRDVAKHTVFADQPMTRAIHALRKLVTGKAVTTDAVTIRKVERERWSASELAHEVPPGHAVLSLTTVTGEHAPPLLVDLRS